jgi:hypothetical protein
LPVKRIALFAAIGGLVLLSTGALALSLPRPDRSAPYDVRDVAALSSSVSPALADSMPPAEAASTAVVAEATSAPNTSEPIRKVVIKRRIERAEEDLVRLIKDAPELALDRTADRADSKAAIAAGREAYFSLGSENSATLRLIDLRPDLAGLPLRRGTACRLSESAAAHFDECTPKLRELILRTDLRKSLGAESNENRWLKSESVPVLMQIMMAEAFDVREILAKHLAHIPGKPAAAALAQLALFDLHPQVRAQAIAGLADRPARDYQQVLLDGFEHPWPVIADHAAEAIVALKLKDTILDLGRLLTARDPSAAYSKPDDDRWFVKEVVRVNHLRNCLLCHPPSFASHDRVRGPDPLSEPPKKRVVPTYCEQSPQQSEPPKPRLFVRADVTYLKQDFSRMLPVVNPGKLPAVQRYDFFVRERLVTDLDHRDTGYDRRAGLNAHQEALVFALRGLTGHDAGPTVREWKAVAFAYQLGK